MKKTTPPLLAVSLVIFFALPASAETQTYSDDFVSFEYDDKSDCKIFQLITEKFLDYYFNPNESDGERHSVSIRFYENQEYIDSFMEASKSDSVTCEPIEGTDNKKKVTSIYGDITYVSIQELAYADGDKSVTISFTDNLDDGTVSADLCNAFLDSIQIVGFDSFPELTEDKEIYGRYQTIYERKHYSDQAIKYAQKALDTCQQYLDMEITGDEAAKIFADIERRTKDNEGDDSDIYWAVFIKDYYFKHGTDKDVYEIMERLHEIVDNQ